MAALAFERLRGYARIPIALLLDRIDARFQIILLSCLTFLVPFKLFYNLVLFHFYVRGSFLFDTGLLASIMYRNAGALTLPPSLGGQSFYAFHVAPILTLVSAASQLLPFSMPQVFAGFVGLCHGLLALAVLSLLVHGYGLRRGLALTLAASAAVAFAFNGLALDIAHYPHFETFGAACLLLFFVALVLRHWPLACGSFLLALLTREDLGLHAFGFLSVWAAVDRLAGVPWRESRRIIGFALAGLAYSGLAIALQHRAFPASSSFGRVYLGDPPLHHLSLDVVSTRLILWCGLHPAIILPAVAVLFWARRSRNPYAAIGYIACIPWAILHLAAASDLAGSMVGYYAYPFLIAMVWPWLAVLIRKHAKGMRPGPYPTAAWSLLALVALSLAPIGVRYDPGRIGLPEAFLHPPSAAVQVATDHAVMQIVAARRALGRLVIDNSVAALHPAAFARDELPEWADAPADTVVFFADGFDSARLRAVPGLPGRYSVPGTQLHIATSRPEQALQGLPVSPE